MMTLFWIILGSLVTTAFWLVYFKLQIPGKMSAGSWILTLTSIFWGAFTLAWAFSSIAENEMQAAGMGLLIFGFILVVMIVVTRKLIISNIQSTTSSVQAAVNKNS